MSQQRKVIKKLSYILFFHLYLSSFKSCQSKDYQIGGLNVVGRGRQWKTQTDRILFAGAGYLAEMNLAEMTLLNFGLARARSPADCWRIEVVQENTSVCLSFCPSLFCHNITLFSLWHLNMGQHILCMFYNNFNTPEWANGGIMETWMETTETTGNNSNDWITTQHQLV